MFDTIWTTAQVLESFCMIPQLYMVSKQGGKVETYTAQFVVLMYPSLALRRIVFSSLVGLRVPGSGLETMCPIRTCTENQHEAHLSKGAW